MKRIVKDKIWISSDEKLLPMDQKTNGRVDRFIGDCFEEVFMAMRS